MSLLIYRKISHQLTGIFARHRPGRRCEAMADQAAKGDDLLAQPGPCQEKSPSDQQEAWRWQTAMRTPSKHLTSKNELQAMVDATNKAFGKVDVFVLQTRPPILLTAEEKGINRRPVRESPPEQHHSRTNCLIQMCMPQISASARTARSCLVSRLAAARFTRSIGA